MQTGAPIQVGDSLLHYRIVRAIGSGGMGTVYEAEDTRLGRPVAIKLLHAAGAHEPGARERFLREARAVAALDHRNLSTIHAIEETPDGTLALVMGLYRGQTLLQCIRSGQLTGDRIVSIGAQIAAGLHVAHMAGVLHRDIKPANIFITSSGEVKILDFGLARLANHSRLTVANEIMGTLAYMSPEQLSGGEVDHRSDLWSLGALLYEMAASYPPFHHPSRSAIMMLICKGEYAPLQRLRPDIPACVHQAIDGALRINPRERHTSAAEVAQLLSAGHSSYSETTALLPAGDNNATSAMPASAHISHTGHSPSRWSISSANTTTIAVLPLENLSPQADDEYFSDGLTDELISALGQVPGLSVVSRTSAFAFKGKGKSLLEIGQALQVETVLEGSVRRAGTKVRVSIQLSDAKTGFQIWASRFDRAMQDVFELQDELASSTVSAIREKLARNVQLPESASPRRPRNADAYDLYLKGRFYWNQKTVEGLQLAGRCFQDALTIDASFADAHAGLSDYYSLLGSLGMMPAEQAWAEARASAMHAVSLDPDLPEAHIALATVLQFYDWDWAGGRREIERALALRPERGQSYESYVIHLMTQGELEQALAQTHKGLKYDPLSGALLSAQAVLHTYLGKHESSILLARETLRTVPHYELYYALGLAFQASGKWQDAVDALQQGLELSRMPLLLGWLAEAHAGNGELAQAEAALSRLLDHANQGSAMPMSIAVAASALGKYDLALTWLERAADAHDVLVGYLHIMPSFAVLRDHPRYHQLARRIHLPAASGIKS